MFRIAAREVLLLPNQSILINLLSLLEAKDSSEIENIVTTTDQLFQHAAEDSQADGPTKEAIHPFDDGNGRTGRILNRLYLIEQNLLSLPILYLSRYILQNKSDYYRCLLAFTTDKAWEDWVCYMLEAVAQTATWTLEKIAAARDLFTHTRDTLRHRLPKIYSHELLELIFEQPYCRIQNLVERDIAKRQTASVHLKQLCDIGVLHEQSAGKEKLFVHPKLIQLMTQPAHTFKPYSGKLPQPQR